MSNAMNSTYKSMTLVQSIKKHLGVVHCPHKNAGPFRMNEKKNQNANRYSGKRIRLRIFVITFKMSSGLKKVHEFSDILRLHFKYLKCIWLQETG